LVLFETKRTIQHFLGDLKAAERNESLRLIDIAMACGNPSFKDSAARVMDCARAVKHRTYSARTDRHCCGFDVPASTDGLLKCIPKLPSDKLLTTLSSKVHGLSHLNVPDLFSTP
jgi:hypothetical protein